MREPPSGPKTTRIRCDNQLSTIPNALPRSLAVVSDQVDRLGFRWSSRLELWHASACIRWRVNHEQDVVEATSKLEYSVLAAEVDLLSFPITKLVLATCGVKKYFEYAATFMLQNNKPDPAHVLVQVSERECSGLIRPERLPDACWSRMGAVQCSSSGLFFGGSQSSDSLSKSDLS